MQISLKMENTGLGPSNLGQQFSGAHGLGICLKKFFIPGVLLDKWRLFV